MDVGIVILAVSALCVGAILAGAAGQKIDAPILLVFLLFGMLAGREGPGGISVDAASSVLVWGSAALAAILFEGGLRTEWRVFRLGAGPGLSLALVGTLVTALIIAPVAFLAFDLPFVAALLLGAIVSSTDAAAVFALAATGLSMPPRVVAALEVESGFNDPLAILLVVGLSVSLADTPLSALGWIGTFAAKIIVGAAVGLGTGVLVPRILARLALPSGLLAILTAGFGFMAFGLAEVSGGSGFLAIYLAGLAISVTDPALAGRVRSVMDGLAWLAQTGLFLLLGLLVTPSHLASLAGPAALIAIALIVLARPVAAGLSLAPFGFRTRDVAFISWVGLRGATPVYLGLLPAALGVPNGSLYLSAAAVVVLLSLVIQGWTAPVVGRSLKLGEDAGAPMGRSGVIARLGAAAASVAVGAFFVVYLQPAAGLAPVLVAPDDQGQLTALLADEAEVPAAFPPGFSDLALEERRPLFVATIMAVTEAANASIEQDRARLTELAAARRTRGRLTLDEEAEAGRIARRYGLRLTTPRRLLTRIDTVPPRLATAQAALATGWGGTAGPVTGNAVFGLGLSDGYPNLLLAAQDLAELYARHPDFADLREARVAAREDGAPAEAEDLAALIGSFAGDAEAYTNSIADILAGPALAPAAPQASE